MNIDDLAALAEEIKSYKDRHEYGECISQMDRYERETIDPTVRSILLTAKATCALQLNDLSTAEDAVSGIDIEPLTSAMRNYVYLTRGAVAQKSGQLDLAVSLFSTIIDSKEAYEPAHRDVLYEGFARLAFLYAQKNQFAAAFDLLERATIISPEGDLRDDIDIYRGYCLQALGRLQAAEQRLKHVLDTGSRELKADAYYRLGAVLLQAGNHKAAIDNFQRALSSLPYGRIARSEILAALIEAKDEQSIVDEIEGSTKRTEAKLTVQ